MKKNIIKKIIYLGIFLTFFLTGLSIKNYFFSTFLLTSSLAVIMYAFFLNHIAFPWRELGTFFIAVILGSFMIITNIAEDYELANLLFVVIAASFYFFAPKKS